MAWDGSRQSVLARPGGVRATVAITYVDGVVSPDFGLDGVSVGLASVRKKIERQRQRQGTESASDRRAPAATRHPAKPSAAA